MTKKNLIPVPNIGAKLKFFDDGKIRPSRMYDAKVTHIIDRNKAKSYDLYFSDKSKINLYKFWEQEVNSHINCENFQVLPYKVGDPWLYARDTDFFVFCDIPEYSELSVIFVRDVSGGWFSLGYPYSADGGVLDVTNALYENMLKRYDEREDLLQCDDPSQTEGNAE